jgi:hypothetical protein
MMMNYMKSPITDIRVLFESLVVDIDECANNASQCGPDQRCENFFGGYSCQCPAGHKLYGKDGCEDIDECKFGTVSVFMHFHPYIIYYNDQ